MVYRVQYSIASAFLLRGIPLPAGCTAGAGAGPGSGAARRQHLRAAAGPIVVDAEVEPLEAAADAVRGAATAAHWSSGLPIHRPRRRGGERDLRNGISQREIPVGPLEMDSFWSKRT